MVVLTIDEMCRSLMHLLGSKGVQIEDVRAIVEHIMNFFGYTDRVIDNILQPEDRDIFYMLEEVGVVRIENFEVTIAPGKGWCIHYWILCKKRLKDIAEQVGTGQEEEESIYEHLSEEVWSRSGRDEQ